MPPRKKQDETPEVAGPQETATSEVPSVPSQEEVDAPEPTPEVAPEEVVTPEPTEPQEDVADETDAETPEDEAEDTTEEPALPDHLTHRIPLDEYTRLRRVNDFQKAILSRAVGAYDRTFEDWEEARRSVLGG